MDWYLTAMLGSVRQILSPQHLSGIGRYDAWGTPRTHPGQRFGFTGERQDSSGLTYLRARWYNPAAGTFLSRDPFAGWGEQPYSLHPYQYAYSDRIMFRDPTGRNVCTGHETPNAYQGRVPPLGYCPDGTPISSTMPSRRPITPSVPHPRGTRVIDYSRSDRTITFIHGEMIRNSKSDVVSRIRCLLEFAGAIKNDPALWVARIMDPQAGQASTTAALTLWASQVRQGGIWDHKWQLEAKLDLKRTNDYWYPMRGDDQHEYYYDIWSNVHYGYVGAAAGFSAMTLLNAANAGIPGTGSNDRGDDLTVQIGIHLWERRHLKLTAQDVLNAVIARKKMLSNLSDGSDKVMPGVNWK